MIDGGAPPQEAAKYDGDHNIGLTRGQHQMHKSPGHTYRSRPSPFYLRECQVISGPDLPRHTDRFGRGAKVSSGQVGNASTQAVPQCDRV
jgi:hypothetical protein